MPLLNMLGSSALVVGGAALAHAQQELATLSGANAGEQFGWSIAFVGDIDGDTHQDFAVGSPGANGSTGKVTVYSGRTLTPIYVWTGSVAGNRYGSALANAGDVDLDGIDDVVIGAPLGVLWWTWPGITPGYVEVRSGRTGSLLYTLTSTVVPRGFGYSVAGGSDVDGDNVPDILVGAPQGPGGDGAVFVFSGASGALMRTHLPPFSERCLGYSVAFLGDVNGDGRAEYAAGAPAAYVPQISYVQLFDGASGDGLWRASIFNENEEFGWSLARIDDLTGDGWPDLLAGSRHAANFAPPFGRVRALDGTTGDVVLSYGQGPGAVAGAGLGFCVADVGDIDGDGVHEFAGGLPGVQPHPSGGDDAFPTRIWSSTSSTPLLKIKPTDDLDDAFGMSLASGDANSDGLRDLLIGEPLDDDNGAESGSVHLYTFVRSVTTYCTAQVNSQGCTPFIAGNGTPSASSFLGFDVTAGNIVNNASGILFYGNAPNNSPHLGGTLCVKQPVRRTAIQNSGGNVGVPDCSGTFSFDFNAWIQSGSDPALAAGREVFAQYWSRDASSFFATTNFTDALAFYINP